MARGWESKSVESQQNETLSTPMRGPLSAEDRERVRRRESLELSRGRIVRELTTARTETHKAALENALQFLDDELRKS